MLLCPWSTICQYSGEVWVPRPKMRAITAFCSQVRSLEVPVTKLAHWWLCEGLLVQVCVDASRVPQFWIPQISLVVGHWGESLPPPLHSSTEKTICFIPTNSQPIGLQSLLETSQLGFHFCIGLHHLSLVIANSKHWVDKGNLTTPLKSKHPTISSNTNSPFSGNEAETA